MKVVSHGLAKCEMSHPEIDHDHSVLRHLSPVMSDGAPAISHQTFTPSTATTTRQPRGNHQKACLHHRKRPQKPTSPSRCLPSPAWSPSPSTATARTSGHSRSVPKRKLDEPSCASDALSNPLLPPEYTVLPSPAGRCPSIHTAWSAGTRTSSLSLATPGPKLPSPSHRPSAAPVAFVDTPRRRTAIRRTLRKAWLSG